MSRCFDYGMIFSFSLLLYKLELFNYDKTPFLIKFYEIYLEEYRFKSLLKLSLRIIECDRFPSSMSKVCLNPTKFSNYVNLSTSLSLRMKEKFFFYFINF